MMQLSTVAAAAIFMAVAAVGQSTSGGSSSTHISLFEAGSFAIPTSGVAGSIIGADATATTIAIACSNSTDCGIGSEALTFTQGPSTFIGDLVTQANIEGNTATVNFNVGCNIVSTTQAATCIATGTATVALGGITVTTTITTTSAFASSDISYDQLLITAGMDKLNNAKATQTSTGAAGAVTAPLPTGNIGLGMGGMAAAAVVAVVGML